MKTASSLARTGLALVALTSLLGGCANGFLASRDRTVDAGLQAGDAYREAARRCGPTGVRQTEGSSGSTPSDYVCTGH